MTSARIGEQLHVVQVAARTGMLPAELTSVAATVASHWDNRDAAFALDAIPLVPGLRPAIAAHWAERGISGLLVVNDAGTSGMVLHDLSIHASAHEVNAYLSHIVDEIDPLRSLSVTLVERSAGDPGEEFCNVIRTQGQSLLPVQSERTMAAADVAERLGVEEKDVLLVLDTMRHPVTPPGCFAHLRQLPTQRVELTGQPVARILG